MAYEPQSDGAFFKGLVASNQPLTQPKGSFPRGSNLIMMQRGGLTPCDGSGIINWFSGAVQNNRGRFMATFLYEPTGVNPYYLALAQATDQHLGAPANLTATDGGAGGSLVINTTYFYKVTVLDGVGGETTVSPEASFHVGGASHKINVTWNMVPNAFGYNVYRSTATGVEVLLAGSNLPVIQPSPLTQTVTFVDDGTATNAPSSVTLVSITIVSRITIVGLVETTANIVLASSVTGYTGQGVTITGVTPSTFNGSVFVKAGFTGTTAQFEMLDGPWAPLTIGSVGTGGTASFGVTPPSSDTTQQTVLFEMPGGTIPVSYSNSNIVAFFPATLGTLGQVPTGGTGGSGTTGPGILGQGSSTPSGGIAGLVGPLPQFKQFTNRAIFSLGNGFSIQVFWDSTGTKVNPAPTGAVSSVAVSNDQVTVTLGGAISQTDPTSVRFIPVGSNVVLSGMSDSSYNGTFTVLAVSGSTFTIRNTSASGGASTGTYTVSTTPIISNFTPAYPVWTVSTAYAVGDIIVPTTPNQPPNAIYLTCTQAGTSNGSTEPGWHSPQPTNGEQFKDNNIIWTVAGLLNSTAPQPPGAGHIEIYAGSLWALNTSPTNTSNGLDGPTALRMSNTNDIFGWNPVNQAYLDKDDGAEGMGLGKFTITAQGIPPEGSLIAFKYRVPYQIIGVFGANNFAIQPVSSDMGCLAPRSIVFCPGFGLVRYTHLGIASFDGWRDQVISEQVRPYLFPTNDLDTQDITVADANYLPLSWSCQTANPPMYAFAVPIGNSGGQLTQIMLFDLILKAWAANVSLPFPIGCMSQVQPVTSNPLTIIGGFNDGALQRWQAGDTQWYTGGGGSAQNVAWSMRSRTIASAQSSQRIWVRQVMIRGTNSGASGTITVQPRRFSVFQQAKSFTVGANAGFDVFKSVGLTGLKFDVTVSGSIHVELEGIDWAVEPRPFGVPLAAV